MNERFVDIKSPLTGGRMKEVRDIEEMDFRGEKYLVHRAYYVCLDTGEKMESSEQTELWTNELYSQYRLRYGIPFPDEIAEIRRRYGLNYSQITRILGFGMNQYNDYEKGTVPSLSNGKMIATIRDKKVIINLLESCRDSMTEKEYKKAYDSITSAQEVSPEENGRKYLLFRETTRSLYNGYAPCNPVKLSDMVKYIVSKFSGGVFPTKLNKLMFYADFLNYSTYGCAISGLRYQAITYGPVPVHYDTVYDNIDGLEKHVVTAHDTESTLLICPENNVGEILTERDKNTIDKVITKFFTTPTDKLVEISHNEPAWQKHKKERAVIPFSEAFDLQVEF